MFARGAERYGLDLGETFNHIKHKANFKANIIEVQSDWLGVVSDQIELDYKYQEGSILKLVILKFILGLDCETCNQIKLSNHFQ